jgi:hypothetical protein
MRYSGKTGRVASAAGTEFARQKSHQRQLRPLIDAERFQELLLGVLKGRINGVNGGNRQARTSG